jgi:hypothetical protein
MGQLKSILQIHLTPILGVSWYHSFTPQSPNLYLTFEQPNPFLFLGFEMTQTQICNEQLKTQSWYYQWPTYEAQRLCHESESTIKWIV